MNAPITLLILCEGQSEEMFVKRVLTPHLVQKNIYPIATIINTKKTNYGANHKGGIATWGKVNMDLKELLKNSHAWVTTLIDFYALPEDSPKPEQMPSANTIEVVQSTQQAIKNDAQNRGQNIDRFIPFLSLHELEAWVFSDVSTLCEHFQCTSYTKSQIQDLLHSVHGNPESINHGAETHPKKRLQKWFQGYSEKADSVTLLEKIGIEQIRSSCPHFNNWLTQIEHITVY
mgnify:CR=1 FL=1